MIMRVIETAMRVTPYHNERKSFTSPYCPKVRFRYCGRAELKRRIVIEVEWNTSRTRCTVLFTLPSYLPHRILLNFPILKVFFGEDRNAGNIAFFEVIRVNAGRGESLLPERDGGSVLHDVCKALDT